MFEAQIDTQAYKALQDRDEKLSVNEMAQEHSKNPGTKIGTSTLYKWLETKKT